MATKSLVAKAKGGTVTALPETGPITVVGPTVTQTPYVAFASTKSPLWPTLAGKLASLDEGDQVLVLPEPQRPVKLTPLRFHLLSAFQYWGQYTPEGDLLRASLESGDPQLKEQLESVVLVHHDGKVVPAGCSFRTTKCAAAHRAVEALKLAADVEEWGKQSPEHQITIGIPVVWARFTACVKTSKRVAKGSGFSYIMATSLIHPTTAAEAKAVSQAFEDEAFVGTLTAVQARFEHRKQDVMGKVK